MTITYKFNDGTESTVEVDEKLGLMMKELEKAELANEKKEHRHCFSLDRGHMEKKQYADPETVESIIDKKENSREFSETYNTLTETQKRRLDMRESGLSLREIAKIEGVNLSKIQKTMDQIQKKYKKFLSEGGQNGI
ncbi:MAG: hypothetical protein IKH13_00985 [Clostridia bacterium]|nr:hypothetical protein [Clostridia bacterium]